jgi:hypothetical protein
MSHTRLLYMSGWERKLYRAGNYKRLQHFSAALLHPHGYCHSALLPSQLQPSPLPLFDCVESVLIESASTDVLLIEELYKLSLAVRDIFLSVR